VDVTFLVALRAEDNLQAQKVMSIETGDAISSPHEPPQHPIIILEYTDCSQNYSAQTIWMDLLSRYSPTMWEVEIEIEIFP
jgi:hypothetical protein